MENGEVDAIGRRLRNTWNNPKFLDIVLWGIRTASGRSSVPFQVLK
jgi:hypothetical protein